MNIDSTKSIEELERDIWGEPEYDSRLVLRCHALRKKPLNEFEVEDLRILTGQNIGLRYLVPLGLKELKSDIMAEGDFYEGDLLNSILTIQSEYWNENKEQKDELCSLFEANEKKIEEFDTTSEIREKLFKGYRELKMKNV